MIFLYFRKNSKKNLAFDGGFSMIRRMFIFTVFFGFIANLAFAGHGYIKITALNEKRLGEDLRKTVDLITQNGGTFLSHIAEKNIVGCTDHLFFTTSPNMETKLKYIAIDSYFLKVTLFIQGSLEKTVECKNTFRVPLHPFDQIERWGVFSKQMDLARYYLTVAPNLYKETVRIHDALATVHKSELTIFSNGHEKVIISEKY